MNINISAEQAATLKAIVAAINASEQHWQVVDVGGGDAEVTYTGSLDPGTLDILDWAFYSRNPALMAKQGSIFSSKVIMRDPVTGRDLHFGDLATADLSGYFPAGGKFGPYL